jgi:hypothetical protein
LNDHVSHVFHAPVEVFRRQGVHVHVWGGVHEIDGVGNPLVHSPFHRVHVVAQGFHEREAIAHDAVVQSRTEVVRIGNVLAVVGVVGHHENFFAAQTHAPHILLPGDELLGDHRHQPRFVVAANQFVEGVAFVDTAPAPAVGILQNAR